MSKIFQAVKGEFIDVITTFWKAYKKSALLSTCIIFALSCIYFFVELKFSEAGLTDYLLLLLLIAAYSLVLSLFIAFIYASVRVLWLITGWWTLFILIIAPVFSVFIFWLFNDVLIDQINLTKKVLMTSIHACLADSSMLKGTGDLLMGLGRAGGHAGGIVIIILLPFVLLQLVGGAINDFMCIFSSWGFLWEFILFWVYLG